MLKYKDIIDKLNIRQKLSLLASGSINPEPPPSWGIPALSIRVLEEFNKPNDKGFVYPPLKSLANTWDTDLIGKVSEEIAARAKNETVNAVITPDLSLRSNLYSGGMTEDVFYGKELISTITKSIKSAGVMPIASLLGITQIDADFMDLEPDINAVNEYFVKPFKSSKNNTDGTAVLLSNKSLSGKYKDINRTIAQSFCNKNQPMPYKLLDGMDAETAVSSLKNGVVLTLNSSTKPLKEAHDRYLKLKDDFDNATISIEEFAAFCNDGDILTDEDVDSAVDRFLDFAFECNSSRLEQGNTKSFEVKQELKLLDAAEKSIVLLKNNENILPLKKNIKLAVIGKEQKDYEYNPALIFIDVLSTIEKSKLPFEYVGYGAGYSGGGERNDELVNGAVDAIASADTVLMFLSLDEQDIKNNRSVVLPVGQLAVLDAAAQKGKNIIAVLCTDCAVDVSFETLCQGLFLMPKSGTYTALALLKALVGELNPSGRLPFTLYSDADNRQKQLKDYKDSKKNKVGAFFGYRYYDTAGETVTYPFGHGLGYTEFKYYAIEADAYKLKFSVKNTGDRSGTEVVQIYLGKDESTFARAKKELIGFARVSLEAGESDEVTVPLETELYERFNPKTGQNEIEGGKYSVYVGASVSDIRLNKSFVRVGNGFKDFKQSLSDYIPSKSNIKDGYTLAEDNSKETVKEEPLKNRTPIEKLFLKEFEINNNNNTEAAEVDEETEIFDNSATMKNVADDLTAYLVSNGIDADASTVRDILCAMSASRIVVLKGKDSAAITEFISAIKAFFGTGVSEETEEPIFASPSHNAVYNAAKAASQNKLQISIAMLEGADLLENADFITPLSEYADSPEKENQMLIKDKYGKKQPVQLPPNLWLLVNIGNEGVLDNALACVCQTAAMIELRLKVTGEPSCEASVNPIGFRQFLKLASDCVRDYIVDETDWKKADALEKLSGVKIGNKLWRKTERFSSVYLYLGSDEDNVLDYSISACMLSYINSRIKENQSEDALDILQMLESSLGDDNTNISQEFVKQFYKN